MSLLQFGITRSPAVKNLQTQLNTQDPTRLPRLREDGDFGVLTKARVMEFQFRQSIDVDGVAGPTTMGKLPASGPAGNPPSGRAILVDLIHRKLTAFNNGTAELRISPIMGGDTGDPSTQGVFQMSSRRFRHHTSSEFPEPPDNMQFSLFYNRGQAIHLGPPNLPSHGCIHVGLPGAEQVFNWAGVFDVIVIVVKLHK